MTARSTSFRAANESRPRGIELHEVRLHLVEVDREACLGQPLAESARVRMVLGEPVDVVIERVEASGRDDSRLAHRPSEEMLEPARLRHALVRPGDDRPKRTAEALREAERDRVELAPVIRRGRPARDGSVHESRAVEMHREPLLSCFGDDLAQMGEGPDSAASAIVSVLDADEPRRRRVQVSRRVDRLAHVLCREDPVRGPERLHDEPGMHGRTAELVAEHVRHLLGEHFVSGLGQRA